MLYSASAYGDTYCACRDEAESRAKNLASYDAALPEGAAIAEYSDVRLSSATSEDCVSTAGTYSHGSTSVRVAADMRLADR